MRMPMRMILQVNMQGDDGHVLELDGFGCACAMALILGSVVACLRVVCATIVLCLRVWSVARPPFGRLAVLDCCGEKD